MTVDDGPLNSGFPSGTLFVVVAPTGFVMDVVEDEENDTLLPVFAKCRGDDAEPLVRRTKGGFERFLSAPVALDFREGPAVPKSSPKSGGETAWRRPSTMLSVGDDSDDSGALFLVPTEEALLVLGKRRPSKSLDGADLVRFNEPVVCGLSTILSDKVFLLAVSGVPNDVLPSSLPAAVKLLRRLTSPAMAAAAALLLATMTLSSVMMGTDICDFFFFFVFFTAIESFAAVF